LGVRYRSTEESKWQFRFDSYPQFETRKVIQSLKSPALRIPRGWGSRVWATLAILILMAAIFAAHSTSSVVEVQNPPNTTEQQSKHYVVLVSLDGFRYDYATKYGAKNLLGDGYSGRDRAGWNDSVFPIGDVRRRMGSRGDPL
jgi:hypothetical protein